MCCALFFKSQWKPGCFHCARQVVGIAEAPALRLLSVWHSKRPVQPCNMSLASAIFAVDSLRQYFLPSMARMYLYEWQLELGNHFACSLPHLRTQAVQFW